MGTLENLSRHTILRSHCYWHKRSLHLVIIWDVYREVTCNEVQLQFVSSSIHRCYVSKFLFPCHAVGDGKWLTDSTSFPWVPKLCFWPHIIHFVPKFVELAFLLISVNNGSSDVHLENPVRNPSSVSTIWHNLRKAVGKNVSIFTLLK